VRDTGIKPVTSSGRPRGEQGRPDQVVRRGLRRSGSSAPVDSRLPVRSQYAAELRAAFGDQQSQRSDLPLPRAPNTANGYKRLVRSSRCTSTCRRVKALTCGDAVDVTRQYVVGAMTAPIAERVAPSASGNRQDSSKQVPGKIGNPLRHNAIRHAKALWSSRALRLSWGRN